MEKQLLISTGIVKNASGSAYVELGNMKIICSVHGPRDTFLNKQGNEKGTLFCDFKYSPFARKDCYGSGGEDRETRSISSQLQQIIETTVDLDSFPKAVVEIYINALEVDGDPFSVALMCASLALTDAGISIYGLLGCACISVMKDNSIVLNPTTDELNNCKCYTTTAIMNSTKEVVHISHCGAVTPEICAMSVSKAVEESSRLCATMRDYLLQLNE